MRVLEKAVQSYSILTVDANVNPMVHKLFEISRLVAAGGEEERLSGRRSLPGGVPLVCFDLLGSLFATSLVQEGAWSRSVLSTLGKNPLSQSTKPRARSAPRPFPAGAGFGFGTLTGMIMDAVTFA